MIIFHLANRADWLASQETGRYAGSPDDHRDGFIHFSTAAQVARSASKHRAGQTDLLLLWTDTARLGTALRWERSSSGDEYPHLYDALAVTAVHRVDPLPLGPDGLHVFPRLS